MYVLIEVIIGKVIYWIKVVCCDFCEIVNI